MSGKAQALRQPALDRSAGQRSAESRAGRALAAGGTNMLARSPGPPGGTPADAALHAFGAMWVHAGAAPAGDLSIGRPDDAHEIEAERAADRALAHRPPDAGPAPADAVVPAGLSPARPGLVQARARTPAGAQGAPDLPQRIADAGVEGRPLSAPQRTFYEQRLGHDFSAVRIHDGPASAAAADRADAQAFTLGHNIYFGESQFRPDSTPGQWLIAHELAHTAQQRPAVIARRAMEGAPEISGVETANAGPAKVSAEPARDDMAQILVSGPSEFGAPSPTGRALPPPQNPSLTQSAADPAAAAAASMQAAVRVATHEAGKDTPANADAAEDAAGAPTAGGAATAPAAGQTELAAQSALSTLDAQLAQLSARSGPVRFQPPELGTIEKPEDMLRRGQSEYLATAFVGGIGQRVETLINTARDVPPQLLAGLTGATEQIGSAATAQSASLHETAEAARRQVRAQSSQTRGAVENKRKQGDQGIDQSARAALDRATSAHGKAKGEIDKQAKAETEDIGLRYTRAVIPMMLVGADAGDLARNRARSKAAAWLYQRNGESSLLDGPLHDDRIEAAADAAIKVGDEYAKSFWQAGNEQAFKIPESKPEVLAKVVEISGQAKQGLDDQLTQIKSGAEGFSKGAKDRIGKASTAFKSAVSGSAKQSFAALDAVEEHQTAEINTASAAQIRSLDETVAAGLAAFADGVGQAVDGLTQSIDEFVTSAASMPPPEHEELAPTLDDVTSETTAATVTMGQQIQAVGPAMTTAITGGSEQSVKMLADTSAKARELAGETKDSFAQTVRGLGRQANTGFIKLSEGDKKTAEGIGTDGERGFVDAAKSTKTAFGQFGEKVDENFGVARQQVRNSLWSLETQVKLGDDMRKYGKEAADRVQPRWKRVLKWVITIVVIVAVIAVTVLTAGALGPVGVVLLGAALGAAAGAVTTIANNVIDGKKWSDGVVKAMIVGAVGGAIGGAGGVALKGVGSVALKIGLEAGVNVVGGIAGEVIGSVAVGESVNWTGAVMGALIGAGIGAGLGIAGALKGKIRIGSFGEAPPAPARPQVEVPPPSGKLRTILEQTKILAPRGGAGVPEGTVAAVPEQAPAAPRRAIGFGEREPIGPTPEPAPAAPRRAIGFGDREPIAPTPEPAPGAPRRAIGFGEREPIAPTPQPVPDAPRRAIGFGDREPIAPTPEPAPGAPRRAIGFGEREPIPPTPEPAPGAPRRAIGFGQREPIVPKPEAAGEASIPVAEPSGIQPLEIGAPPGAAPPEAVPSGAGAAGGHEPVAAGGRSLLDVQASGQGGGRGAGPKPAPARPTTPRPARPSPPATAEPAAPGSGPRTGQPGAAKGPPGEPAPAQEPAGAGPEPAKKPPSEHAQKILELREAKKAAAARARQDAKSAAAERARRDADSAAIQREAHGIEETPTRRPGSVEEAQSFDEGVEAIDERFGDISPPPSRRGGQAPDLRELPNFPESVEARGMRESLEFYKANIDEYPPHIRKAIQQARTGRGIAKDVKEIDAMIRSEHAKTANRALGFEAESTPAQAGTGPTGAPAFEPSSPFETAGKGHSPLGEGTAYERGATLGAGGRPKELTLVGQTKTSGKTVQIDDFDFQTRTPKEIKMPLALKQDPRYFAKNSETIIDQMHRQAEFARDWKFSPYEWEMYTPQDKAAAEALLARVPPDLQKWINITEFK